MVENNTDFLNYLSIENISYYSPWIGFFGTSILLFFQNNPLLYISIFIIGFFMNIFLNKFLKQIITDKRPINNNNNQKSAENRMPSGHSQTIFYIISFLSILLFKNRIKGVEIKIWIGITILLGLLTSYIYAYTPPNL